MMNHHVFVYKLWQLTMLRHYQAMGGFDDDEFGCDQRIKAIAADLFAEFNCRVEI